LPASIFPLFFQRLRTWVWTLAHDSPPTQIRTPCQKFPFRSTDLKVHCMTETQQSPFIAPLSSLFPLPSLHSPILSVIFLRFANLPLPPDISSKAQRAAPSAGPSASISIHPWIVATGRPRLVKPAVPRFLPSAFQVLFCRFPLLSPRVQVFDAPSPFHRLGPPPYRLRVSLACATRNLSSVLIHSAVRSLRELACAALL